MEKTMDKKEAKQIVCDAGRKLVKEGLVARTWGNISVRVDSETFVITPSGRTYEALTPDDIVEVRIEDCGYEGEVKPSSEKGLHAEVYKQSSDINAVVHTHQMNASTVAAARQDVPLVNEEMGRVIGPSIRVAPYGLPGTGKLAKGTAASLLGRKAALMANHGAVCIGGDMEEAFEVSRVLEKVCGEYIQQQFLVQNPGVKEFDYSAMHRVYLEKIGRGEV